MGSGTSQNFWNSRNDGVKITVIRDNDNAPITTPIDFTNRNQNGIKMTMTAHEAALYDEKLNSGLRSKMLSLSNKNLPLAIFLETSDLDFSAWTGATNKKVTNAQIKSSLGLGIVRFSAADVPPEVETNDYEYRCDTDVVTSITVSTGRRRTVDNPVTVTFTVGGRSYRVNNIYIPEGESQLVWFKWHTPSKSQKTNATLGEWDCFWEAKWEWCDHGESGGHWVDRGKWVDNGDWKYKWLSYSASLTANMTIQPDSKVPTASGSAMKSGYGINAKVSTSFSSNAPNSHITAVQNVLTYYPEFNYQTYLRLMDKKQGGYSSEFQLKQNKYSTYNQRVHFTPVWYPDGKYTDCSLFTRWRSCNLFL